MNYGLIHNGHMKVGPREYSKVFFEQYLQSQGIDYDLPSVYDSADPIIVNSDIKISQVEEINVQPYDSLTEQLAGPFWRANTNPITGW